MVNSLSLSLSLKHSLIHTHTHTMKLFNCVKLFVVAFPSICSTCLCLNLISLIESTSVVSLDLSGLESRLWVNLEAEPGLSTIVKRLSHTGCGVISATVLAGLSQWAAISLSTCHRVSFAERLKASLMSVTHWIAVSRTWDRILGLNIFFSSKKGSTHTVTVGCRVEYSFASVKLNKHCLRVVKNQISGNCEVSLLVFHMNCVFARFRQSELLARVTLSTF